MLMFSSYGTAAARRRGLSRAAAILCLSTLTTGLLGACGDSRDPAEIGVRQWGSFNVAVEVRPSPPQEGRNEVVVIISGEHHRPVFDALVSIRVDSAEPWVQAIEDGHVGVYRRGAYFRHGPAATLQVRLQRADEQTVLEFPFALAPSR